MSKWASTGVAAGIIYGIGSFWRYYVVYPDLSEAVTGIAIGMLIVAVSFLYQWRIDQSHTLEAIEEYLADKQNERKK